MMSARSSQSKKRKEHSSLIWRHEGLFRGDDGKFPVMIELDIRESVGKQDGKMFVT